MNLQQQCLSPRAPVVVQLRGGLGNQLFQFAFGYALVRRRGGAPLLVDARRLSADGRDVRETPRRFHLDAFMVDPCHATEQDLAFLSRPGAVHLNKIRNRLLEMGVDLPGPVLLTRYWQALPALLPVERDLRRVLRLHRPEPLDADGRALYDHIRSACAVGVHVRRGDYAALPLFNVLTGDYFARAAATLRAREERTEFFVFSDDIEWCRRFIPWPFPVTYVTCAADTMDAFRLLRACRHYILSNSTFGWWAAWLGAGAQSVVLAPDCWFADPRADRRMQRDLYPDSWERVRIDRQ